MKGKVSVSVNDSVFQISTPVQSGVISQCQVLMKYSDGGTDHGTTLEAVFKILNEYDLDTVILARCAPCYS